MQLNEYQNLTQDTAIYPGANSGRDNYYSMRAVQYCALGLANEAGEVAGKIKKMIRDYDGVEGTLRKETLKELGDTLWYLARLADELDCDLETVANQNIIKLKDRKERGVLGGSGDNR